jgi:hypothetical protein
MPIGQQFEGPWPAPATKLAAVKVKEFASVL